MTQPASSTLVARLTATKLRAMDRVGTIPARQAVLVVPADWHAVTDGLTEATARITELEAEVQRATQQMERYAYERNHYRTDRLRVLNELSAAESQLERVRAETCTYEMTLAGARSIGNSASTDNHVQRARECWAAMIAARFGVEQPVPSALPAPPHQKTEQTRSQKDGSR